MAADVSVALVHYPVLDRSGQTMAAAVTSLDLHDIARSALTYGVKHYYVVTPLVDQQELVKQIIAHWLIGAGSQYNPDRRKALALIRLLATLGEVRQTMARDHGTQPLTVVTSARMLDSNLSYTGLKSLAHGDIPVLLVFGTSWGLAPEIIDTADYRLAPLEGCGGYNHLAVRSAAAIILDRMLGRPAGVRHEEQAEREG